MFSTKVEKYFIESTEYKSNILLEKVRKMEMKWKWLPVELMSFDTMVDLWKV